MSEKKLLEERSLYKSDASFFMGKTALRRGWCSVGLPYWVQTYLEKNKNGILTKDDSFKRSKGAILNSLIILPN